MAVKKKNKPLSKSYPPVKMYLDDVRDLVALLTRLCGKVTLYSGESVFHDYRKLKTLPYEKIHDLRLEGKNPQVSVVLRHDYVRVFVEEDFMFGGKILSEIEKVLKPCYRKIARIFANYVVIFLISFTLITLLVLNWKFNDGALRAMLMTLFLMFYAAISIFNYKIEKVYSTIVLSKK
jgi:hypothetical protein